MKRLYRSRESAMLAGVCGGIGEYFSLDPVIVRIIFLLLIPAGGIGLLAYAICWLAIPRRPESENASGQPAVGVVDHDRALHFLPGLALIVIGAAILMGNLWGWIPFKYLVPAVIIAIGLGLLIRAMTTSKEK